MYALASKLFNLPVVSLQTGRTIATIKSNVIDPATLEAVAFMCSASKHGSNEKALMLRDVREIALDCVIVDSEEELTDPEDIIRLQQLRQQAFNLIGIAVKSDMGRSLGSAEDFTINVETNKIQKLYIKQSFIHSFFGASLIVDRTQIVDVQPKRIVVREATLRHPSIARPMPDSNP